MPLASKSQQIMLAFATQQIAALVLAVRIRNVKIKVVNDSKEIVAIVYFCTLQFYNHASDALIIGHVLFIGLIFIPKVSSTYCILILPQIIDPHGEKVFTHRKTSAYYVG